MKPGWGPHVRIGVLANFTPSLGTRLSSSLKEGGQGIRLQGSEPRPLGLPTLRYQIPVPVQPGISHGELPGLSWVSRAHGAGHAVAEESIGPRSKVLRP